MHVDGLSMAPLVPVTAAATLGINNLTLVQSLVECQVRTAQLNRLEVPMIPEPPKVLLIQPRYAANRFMGHYDTPCELVGARQPMPPLGLLTVAAMLPRDWPV